MEFSNTSQLSGLIQDCETLLGMDDGTISGDSTLLKTFTRLMNAWYRRVNSWIWEVTGTWEYDDTNYTDLPEATTSLVNGQEDYTIPSTAQKIIRVEVLDKDGNYRKVEPIDQSMVDVALSEFQETDGLPMYYDIRGNSIFLYPAPSSDDVTLTKGLKVYFSRDIDEFSSTDTTKEPGFVRNFHRILSLGASYDYAISHEMFSKANYIKGELRDLVKELRNFYGARPNRELKTRFNPKRYNYK